MQDDGQEYVESNGNELVDDKEQIENEFSHDRSLFEKQIDHLGLIEQKINYLIYDLEAANQHLQTLIENETDVQKKRSYHTAIAYNVERLTKLYSVLREYQDTKYKYYSTMGDLTYKKNRLMHIELSKIKDTSGSDNYMLINRLLSAMGGTQSLEEVEEINQDDEYKV